MPRRNPRRLYIHIAFTYSVGPSSVGEVNLYRLHLSHQWECLKCNAHGPSVSCVKWPMNSRMTVPWAMQRDTNDLKGVANSLTQHLPCAFLFQCRLTPRTKFWCDVGLRFSFLSINKVESLQRLLCFCFWQEADKTNAGFLSSRDEISQLGIEPPTSSLRFGYLSTVIQ